MENQNGIYEYLMHHGILGQKWGKRNGPPYPLSRQKRVDNSKKSDGIKRGHSVNAKTIPTRVGGGGGKVSENDDKNEYFNELKDLAEKVGIELGGDYLDLDSYFKAIEDMIIPEYKQYSQDICMAYLKCELAALRVRYESDQKGLSYKESVKLLENNPMYKEGTLTFKQIERKMGPYAKKTEYRPR